MRKIFNQLFRLVSKRKNNIATTSISTVELLQRDLENCLTLSDLQVLKCILEDCKSEFSKDELLTFLLNISYRKQLIEFCDSQLTCKRYPAHKINLMFSKTKSLAFCDAVLLHIKRNSKYYTSEFYSPEFDTLPAMSDITVFKRMAEKKQAYLYNQFLSQIPI